MLNIKKYVLFAAVLLLQLQALGQESLTLDTILNRIDQNNAYLKAFNSRAKSISVQAQGAKAWMPPMIGAGTYMTPYPRQGQVVEQDKGALMFSLEQEIPNPAKLNRKQEYQRSLSSVEIEGRENAFNDLRFTARKLYYQWLVAEKRMEVVQENDRILLTLKKLARIRYSYNKGNLSSIYAAEAKLFDVENMQMLLESEIRKKQIGLNTLMNRPAQEVFKIDTSTEVKFNPLAGIDTSYLSQSRSEIRKIDKNIASMKLNTEAAKAEARPDLRIRFDHMANRDAMMPAQFTAMAMISIPIAPWSAKGYRSEVKAMQLNIEAMKNERRARLIETENIIQSMLSDLMVMEHHLDNYQQKIIPALRKSFDASHIAYEENQSDLPTVIRAWEELNMARMKYLDEMENYYLMIAEYEKEIEK